MTDLNPELVQVLLDQQTELQASVNRMASDVTLIREQLVRLNGNVQRNDERSREALALASANKDVLAKHETQFATLGQETKTHTANWKTAVEWVLKAAGAVAIAYLLLQLGLQ